MTLQLALSVGRTCALVGTTVEYGKIGSTSNKSASGRICNKMISSISNVKEIEKNIEKAIYIPPIQVEATFEREATSPTGEMIIKPCNERLMT